MRFLFAALLALTFALSGQAADTGVGPQWQCLDRNGTKVVQSHPCDGGMVEWQPKEVPGYVWGIVAVLGMIWLAALMPQRTLMRWRAGTPSMPELLPVGMPPLANEPGGAVADAAPVQDRAVAARPAVAAPAPAAPKLALVRPSAWSLDAITRLSPRRCEELVQALWLANGYKAVLTGTDINIHHAATGRLFAIARAATGGGAVGVGTVQGLWSAVQQHAAGLGVCYGPSGFSIDALAYAEGKRVKLVSGAELLAQIRVLKPEPQKALLEHIWRA